MTGLWLRGLLARRRGRVLAAAGGLAVAVALLASLGSFLASARTTMTARAAQGVAVDWQVEVQPGADPSGVLAATRRAPGVRAALPVTLAASTGFEASTGGTTQTTGPGVVLGLPPGYRHTFPGQVRTLTGSGTGVLLAQQTAANLHAAVGDTVSVGRAGLSAVRVRVAGIVDLPQADSLFQQVGAPPQAQPQAPPDNVMLLPASVFQRLMGPLAARPGASADAVRTQVHVRRTHNLAHDPTVAYTQDTGAAHNLEVRTSGAALVGDNLGAALDGARGDALYSQVLFLFLGLPGAVLAAAVTAAVVGAGASRRRRERSLLRTRGSARSQLMRLAAVEALAVGLAGGLFGLALAALIGRWSFGSVTFGATTRSALIWTVVPVVAGVAVSLATTLLPARRELRDETVAAGIASLAEPSSTRRTAVLSSLTLLVLACSGAVFWATSRTGYSLVLAPEGVPTISVSYWAFLGPALLWVGCGLLAFQLALALLGPGRGLLARALRPLAGTLAPTVAATLHRHRRTLARSVVLVVLATSFAASTATFNATYKQQAEVDATLTNGADVVVTESPGATVGPSAAKAFAALPGVQGVEPLQHRFAYVGADLQDLYGVRPSTVVGAAHLQDAYFQGATAQQLMDRLAARPDSVLVSAETVKDFQLHPGDQVKLRLQDTRTHALVTVPFTYAGVAKEFPTAPRDSFLVANASYVAARTGSPAVGAFLVDTGGGDAHAVAARVRSAVGPTAKVTDITQTRTVVGSSLTAVDLAGLTRVELLFALVLVAAAGGLVLWLDVLERRRTFAVATVLGGSRRQVRAFVVGEALVVGLLGLVGGAIAAWGLTHMLVSVLTGVFDPPPAQLSVPWSYLVTVGAAGAAALVAVVALAARTSRRPAVEVLREA
jgi:putative ABC transport system permease protein